jgi:hypothetical protein
MLAVVAEYLAMSRRHIVFVVDNKGTTSPFSTFKSIKVASVEDLANAKPMPGARVVIFGAAGKDPVSIAEGVAALAMRQPVKGISVLTVVDEAAPLCDGSRFSPKAPSVKRLFTEGRSQKLSVLWGTQRPQDTQGALLSETSSVFCWGVSGHGITNLKAKDFLNGDGVEVAIKTLPRPAETPPKQRGTFLHLSSGQDWDKKRYRIER